MEMRIDPRKVAPEVYRAMFALESAVKATGLEGNLLDLVKLRVLADQWVCILHRHAQQGLASRR